MYSLDLGMLQFFKKYSQTSIEKTKSEYKRPTRIAIKLLSMDFQRIISPLSFPITHPNMIPASEHIHRRINSIDGAFSG